jgi:hypothetical protein
LMVSKGSADSFAAVGEAAEVVPALLPTRNVFSGCSGSVLPAATPMRRMIPYTSVTKATC